MANDGLKPCPFCGKADQLELDSLGDPNDWYVECNRCNLGTHAIFVGARRAAEKWNSRPLEAEFLDALKGIESTYVFLDSLTAGMEPQHSNTLKALATIRSVIAKAEGKC